MKQGIMERLALIRSLVDAYTRAVEEFAEHDYDTDRANDTIDRNSGCTRGQLHEQAKMIRREILNIDKDVCRTVPNITDREGLGR